MKKAADLEIQYRQADILIPYARNARTHSDEQISQVAASLREFGWTNPVLVDGENGIIAGHCRVLAARKLGMSEIPVIELGHLSDAQRRAYILADNRLALDAGWDNDFLALEIADLDSMDFNLGLTGFSDIELAKLSNKVTAGKTGPDEAPEAPAVAASMLGDVWLLGPHRLICGDSTGREAIQAVVGAEAADMIFTDPPYGMSYEGGRGKKQFGTIMNDTAQGEALISLVREALSCAKAHSKTGAAAYVCFPWRTYAEFERAVVSAGFHVAACIVWDKQSFGLGHQDYRPQHEFIFYSTGGAWYGDRAQSDVWACKRDSHANYVHPTQKPVELITRALWNSSKPGDKVIDCFGGSGSTLIACEQTGRSARVIELDPKYCDVIVNRWQAFTGLDATHEGAGRTFDEIAAERLGGKK
ncbi:site-specific DNA-methyltransferase [Burkholderia sp. Bp9142]|uniref:site-specific DNA-methyltransferase n=1 Tax=Burkholderia sp. Bp9142 TaxID=2184573 RepID=UPI000F58F780|nr:site-specific DNA-methyltransferase [Burkholderia sp. Bp9142]RQR29407.1 DNA methylase [Burkholderia sp. Bp9142]